MLSQLMLRLRVTAARQVDEAKPGAGLGIGLADVDVFDYKRHILGVSRTCTGEAV